MAETMVYIDTDCAPAQTAVMIRSDAFRHGHAHKKDTTPASAGMNHRANLESASNLVIAADQLVEEVA